MQFEDSATIIVEIVSEGGTPRLVTSCSGRVPFAEARRRTDIYSPDTVQRVQELIERPEFPLHCRVIALHDAKDISFGVFGICKPPNVWNCHFR